MNYKEMEYNSYITDASVMDEEFMKNLKRSMADQTVQAFAEFLHENPDLVKVDSKYVIERGATLVTSRIRVQEWEE